MSMETARDLFEHELLDMYDAEHRVLKALPAMAKETTEEKLRTGFERHAEETKQHIERLEQCCETLGIKAEREPCPGMAGLIKEHDQFLKEEPSEDVLTLFLLGSAEKTEHYEMVGYRGLIDMAKIMGEKKVAGLLTKNLSDEEAMTAELEKLQQGLDKKLVKAAS